MCGVIGVKCCRVDNNASCWCLFVGMRYGVVVDFVVYLNVGPKQRLLLDRSLLPTKKTHLSSMTNIISSISREDAYACKSEHTHQSRQEPSFVMLHCFWSTLPCVCSARSLMLPIRCIALPPTCAS